MKVLVDMNLAPAWVECLSKAGWEAAHWSSLGDPYAADADILRFARERDWIVLTHDLDFGAILAHTQTGRPSVIQVRTRDVSPDHLAPVLIRVLRQFTQELERGVLLTVDEARQRVRLLPIA